MKILVLGATGMLGNVVYKQLSLDPRYKTWGTVRSAPATQLFTPIQQANIVVGVDALNGDHLASVLAKIKPDVIINCVGLIKQISTVNDPLTVLPINSLFPHRLAKLCDLMNCRLVLISTDCVFSGARGMYTEDDASDAKDLYGKSKYLGEVHESANVVTLRTSIIGHELNSKNSLIDWFLSQEGSVKGYSRAIFSGFPTVELSRIISDFVLPRPELHGLYHVSAAPIDKYTLLGLTAKLYNKAISIVPDDDFKIDRSLDSTRFRSTTGYVPPDWKTLVSMMHQFR